MKNFSFFVITLLLIVSCQDSCNNGNIDTCDNLQLDNGEEGLDCGGPCAPCFPVITGNEVMIIDTAIVDSEEATIGDLSFQALMARLTNSQTTTKDLVLSFMSTWDDPVQINNILVAPRTSVRLEMINNWKNRDNQSGVSDANWQMNMENAPFHLLAINSRFDLFDFSKDKVGEGRLTFGMDNGFFGYTMIFECDLRGNTENDRLRWAKRWHQLSNLNKFSQAYMDTLVSIVKDFSSSHEDLSQLRTNEFFDSPWELREMKINDNSGLFEEVTRKQSPSIHHQGSPLLRDYVITHTDELLEGNHTILDSFQGEDFMAGQSTYGPNFTWQVSGLNSRQDSALDVITFISCVGCHGGLEPNTGFTHIKPRNMGFESNLSSFTMADISDRADTITDLLSLPTPPVALLKTTSNSAMDTLFSAFQIDEISQIKSTLARFSNVKRVH